MDRSTLQEVLDHFRSFHYAARMGEDFLDGAPSVYNERRRSPNRWDATRYSRIVAAVSGAIDDVLTDEQAEIIRQRYLERNPQTFEGICEATKRDFRTVKKRYNQAMYRLQIALSTFETDYELTEFEHMFEEQDE